MAPQKSAEQCKVFLDFMEAHPDIAKGFVKGDKLKHDQLWIELTSRLNACGPPHRDCSSWKKTWSDWRRSIKTRLVENKLKLKYTGRGKHQQHYLSEEEERLAVVCDIYHDVNGIESAKSFGCQKRKHDETLNIENFYEIIEFSSASSTPEPPVNSHAPKVPILSPSKSPVLPFIKKPTTFCGEFKGIAEENHFEYMAAKLDKINKTLHENAKCLKDVNKNIDEIRSLKIKELEETKRHNLEIEKLKKTKIEIKMEFLKMERMKLGMNDKEK